MSKLKRNSSTRPSDVNEAAFLMVQRSTAEPEPMSAKRTRRPPRAWSVRTSMRRYTRLSNGFSRKLENHAAATALNYFAYNFIKIHRTLRISLAMAACVADQLWEVSDLVAHWESYKREAERRHEP